jgi:hypothetical protein
LRAGTRYIVEAYWASGETFDAYEWLLPTGWTSIEGGTQNPFISTQLIVRVTAKTLNGTGYIRVRGRNACGLGAPFSLPVSTACSQSLFAVYPNPAEDHFTVTFNNPDDQQDATLSIYDDKGVKRQEQKITREEEPVSTAKLAPGIYYIHVQTITGASRRRLVVTKK